MLYRHYRQTDKQTNERTAHDDNTVLCTRYVHRTVNKRSNCRALTVSEDVINSVIGCLHDPANVQH